MLPVRGIFEGAMGIISYIRNTNRLFAIVVICIASIMFVLTGSLGVAETNDVMGASAYPKFILICIIVLSCVVFFKPAHRDVVPGSISLRGLPVIVSTALYISLIEYAGFFIITPLFLLLLPLLAGFRSYRLIGISVIVVTASLYGVFVEILAIPLPAGILAD
jgi:putative tricarboxylic transport membrane protein